VPGIGPSDDKMLQARLFSYHDTHLHRLGPNYHLLPINAAKPGVAANYQRDGAMRFDDNGGAGPNYWPNSFGGPIADSSAADPRVPLAGVTGRQAYTHPNDDFVQAGTLYSVVMTDDDRAHLVSNIVGHLGGAQKRIQLRQSAQFYRTHPEYGTRVAEGLGLDAGEVARLAAMSQEELVAATAR